MASGKEKSESLFGGPSVPIPEKTKGRRIRPQGPDPAEKAAVLKKLKNDYIFKNELKDVFEQKVGNVESSENNGVIRQVNQMQTHVIRQENALLKIAGERRKRHYALNGDVKVYCYVKNQWPKLIVRPLTIRIADFPHNPPLGPFAGEDETLLEVIFRPMTVGVKRQIDPFIYEPLSTTSDQLSINTDEYKRLAFFCCFKSWNIPVDLPFGDNGKLSEEALSMINNKIHPQLFDVVSSEFIGLNEISKNESDLLDQQCDRLFGKGGKGVSNPLEGIKLYCEASIFAKEFSLSGRDLDDLPVRVSSMIRHVAQKGSDIHSKEMDKGKNQPKRAKVIGTRGKR